jgi:hypothetical protein
MMDLRLEVVVVPVSDVDRAKAFTKKPASTWTSIRGRTSSFASSR